MRIHLQICQFFISTQVLKVFSLSSSARSEQRFKTGIISAGDIIIGGLIPVHFSPNFSPHPGNSSCQGSFHLRGFKGVEAMLYAVDLINKNSTLLPNATLGVDIKDTCGSVDYAIMESLGFDFIRSAYIASELLDCAEDSSSEKYSVLKPKADDRPSPGKEYSKRRGGDMSGCCSSKSRTAAVVGAAFSGVTMATASLTGLFHVPVISYASTSRLLSDRSRFQYFFRTVPSDNFQAQAVTSLLHKFQWHFVILLASDNEYGRSGVTALKQTIQSYRTQDPICVVVDELFSRKGSRNEMTHIFRKIHQFPQAKVIILYAEFPDAVYFFQEAKMASLRNYMFIATDSWVGSTEVIKGSSDIFKAIIGLRPPIKSMPKFDAYFLETLKKNNSRNPWASECNKSLICSEKSTERCQSEVHHDGYVAYIMDAVFSVAHALHTMLGCNEKTCAKKWRDVDIRDLPQFIQNVSFAGYSQKNIFFNEEGSTRGHYDVYYLGKESSTYARAGSWSQSELKLNLSRISLYGSDFPLPASICSNHCRKGEYKIPKSQFPECCWDCAKCDGKSFTNTSHMTKCSYCPVGTWPTADHSECSPIEAAYLHWDESWAVVIVLFSSFGLAIVTFTGVVFIKFRATPVVRAASRQLCYFLLLGIAMFYVTPLPYIAKPSAVTCRILPVMFGLCFVLVVGTILIRTNRVSRIFNEKLLRTGKIGCLGNHWQMFILGCLLTTEIVLTVAWVYGSSSPVLPQIIYSKASKEASLICNLSGSHIGFSLWLIYNAGLVVVCTYQAFLVRKVPQNYNESRLIAFNMTTLCITVLVYIPSYMGTSGWYRTVMSCFMFIFLGTLTWVSIFAPKIYIVLFRPHKNIPMRPSVSSITLGVITPTPVVSSISDQYVCSRQNSLTSNEDGTWGGLWGGLWAKFDSARDLNENVAISEKDDSQKKTEEFYDFSEKELKENQETETSTAAESQSQQENSEVMPLKNTSVVHFEDELATEINEGKDTTVVLRKKTSGSQGGILRRPWTSESLESPSNGIVTKKKKTSLVRFQDEVLSCVIDNSTDYHGLVFSAKGEESSQMPKEKLDEENNHKREQTETSRVTGQDRTRKISVFSFQ